MEVKQARASLATCEKKNELIPSIFTGTRIGEKLALR